MAVSVNTVYSRVLVLANKEQRGYITPQEFNLLANQAQMKIFESYFYSKNLRNRQEPNRTNEVDETDIDQLLDMKLRPFSRVLSLNDNATVYPTTITVDGIAYPVFQTGRVFHNGDVAQKVSLNQLEQYRRSIRHSLSADSPIYADSPIDGDDVIVFNNGAVVTGSVDVECFRIPVTAEWAYVVVNNQALFNANAAVDFELHRSEEDTLVNKILELSGIVINKPDVTSIGAQMGAAELELQKL